MQRSSSLGAKNRVCVCVCVCVYVCVCVCVRVQEEAIDKQLKQEKYQLMIVQQRMHIGWWPQSTVGR